MGNKFEVALSQEATKQLIGVLGTAHKQKAQISGQDPFGMAIDLVSALVTFLVHQGLVGLEKLIYNSLSIVFRDKQPEQLKLRF